MMKDENSKILKALSLVTQIGLMLIACALISMYAGSIADNLLNTGAFFKIVFLIGGLAAGMWSVYKLIMRNVN